GSYWSGVDDAFARGGKAVWIGVAVSLGVAEYFFALVKWCFFFFFKQKTAYEIGLGIPAEPLFRSLTILSKTDALDEEKWLNMLGTFVKDWFRYESHFVHGRDSLVDILKERGLLSESDAVQPLIGKKS